MKEINTEQGFSPLVNKAQAFTLQLFGQRQDGRLLVHNYSFAASVSDKVAEIISEEGVNQDTAECTQLAAWLLPGGYLYDYQNPAQFSQEVARQFFSQNTTEEGLAERVIECIGDVLRGDAPISEEVRILSDAVQAATYLPEQEEKAALLQLERELILGQRFSRSEWPRLLLEELLRVKLHTQYAQAILQPRLAQAIYQTRRSLEKRLEKEDVLSGPFSQLEEKIPQRGAQTFFRTNYRNHINLSSLADNKANIMISVNAILLSVLITFLSYRNIGENTPEILLPVVLFLVTGLASLIFAVLSARPKVTMLNPKGTSIEEARKNVIFFGNFVTLSPEEYEEAMDELFNDSQLLYGNMVRDLYNLGKVLDKKYRYLSISYNVFMVGFIATVSTFLIALFT